MENKNPKLLGGKVEENALEWISIEDNSGTTATSDNPNDWSNEIPVINNDLSNAWVSQNREPRGGLDWFKKDEIDFEPTKINAMAEGLKTNDLNSIRKAVVFFRTILSKEKAPPIERVIKTGIVPILINLLTAHKDDEIMQLEIVWIFTNITSGHEKFVTLLVKKHDITTHLMEVVKSSENDDVLGQTYWALANIAADYRDDYLKLDFAQYFKDVDFSKHKRLYVQNATLLMCNLCRGKPSPPMKSVVKFVPIFKRIYNQCKDRFIRADAMWGFNYLTDNSNELIQVVIECGIMNTIVKDMDDFTVELITPAVRTIGNICSGTDEQTFYVVNLGVIKKLKKLISYGKESVEKESVWTIANIAAGVEKQVKAILKEEIYADLVAKFKNESTSFKIKSEIVWAIANALSGMQSMDVKFARKFVKDGCIGILGDSLKLEDVNIVLPALEGIENFLTIGKTNKVEEEFVAVVEPYVGELENLQNHKRADVYRKSLRILEKFFEFEEDGDVPDPHSPVPNNNPYQQDFMTRQTPGAHSVKTNDIFKKDFNF